MTRWPQGLGCVSKAFSLFQGYLTTDLAIRADYGPKSQAGFWNIMQGKYEKCGRLGVSTWKGGAGQELLPEKRLKRPGLSCL